MQRDGAFNFQRRRLQSRVAFSPGASPSSSTPSDLLPECGHDCVRTRSGVCYQCKLLNMSPATRKQSLDDVQSAESDEQRTGATNSSRTSRDNASEKQKKATTRLEKQQRPSRAVTKTDSVDTIPAKEKSHKRNKVPDQRVHPRNYQRTALTRQSATTSVVQADTENAPKLVVSGAPKKGRSEQGEPFVKPQPWQRGRSTESASRTPKPKASECTEALLPITAGKGTLKRKAAVKKLADALAAKEACDDMHRSYVGGNIPGHLFVTEKCDELFDIDTSTMKTPPLFSPLLSPESRFSFSSVSSVSSESPVAAAAIMRSIRKRRYATNLESSTPKSEKYRKKSLNIKMVAQGLQNLEAKLQKERLKENCEDFNAEVEGTDVESSEDDQSFFQ